jgi:hypothetical protein
LSIRIIEATPGPTTTERILELILAHPQGLTARELSKSLNRPVSMINHCLKRPIASKQVCVRLSESGMQQIYFPNAIAVTLKNSIGDLTLESSQCNQPAKSQFN